MEDRFELAALHRGYVPPAGLRISRPREVTLSTGGRLLFVLAILLFAAAAGAAVGLSWQISKESFENQLITTTGVDTTGTVSRLTRKSDEKKAGTVAYTFVAGGREYRGRAEVALATWRTLQVGSPFGVRYAASDPNLNVRQGARLDTMPRGVPYVIGGVLAALGLICLAAIQWQRDLLTDGRVAPARVTGHIKHASSHGGSHREITYEFAVLSGAIAAGKAAASKKPPAVGSVICVIYDPDEPTRNRPYPLGLVRPAGR